MLKTITKILTSSYSGAGLIFFVQVLTAKSMTVEDFGMIAATLALVALISPIVGFGLDSYIYKYSASNSGNLFYLMQPAKKYVFGSCCVAILFFLFFVENRETTLMAFMIFSQFSLGMSLAILQIRSKYNYFSILSLCQGFVRLMLFSVLIFFYGNVTLKVAVNTYFVSALIVLLFSSYVIYSDLKNTAKPRIEEYTFTSLVRDSLPFGIGTLSFIIYSQSVIYFINKFDGPKNAALFSVSYVFLTMTFMIPSVLYQKFLIPKLHALVYKKVDVSKIFAFGNTLMFILGVFFSFTVYIFSDLIVNTFFGARYLEASELLKSLTVIIFLRFISANSAAYLMTGNFMKVKNKIMLTVAVINVILMVLFVPIYGVDGAISIIIFSEVIISVSYIYYVKNKFFTGQDCKMFFGFDYKGIKRILK